MCDKRLVLRQGLRLVAIGVPIGALVAVGLTKAIAAMLFGAKPLDPLTFGVVGNDRGDGRRRLLRSARRATAT
jgi:hypothetical protein